MSPSYIKLESEISESFGNLLENKTESNVIIHVGEENGKYIIKEPKILPQAFEVILKYLYTGHINFDKNSGPVLLNIISASNKFMLKRLVIITEDFIIKNHQSDSEKIVGGYNPLGWDSSGITKPAMNSYIFKFSDRRKLQTANISYSNGNPQSIICNSDIFGFNDLYNYNCTWIGSNPSSYPKLDGIPKGVFYVDDYEVFQVKRETTIDNSRRVSRSSRTSQSLKINGSTRTSQIETGLLNGFSQVEKENLGNEVVDEKRLSRVSTFVKTLFGKDK
ncbi:uncharacterized protein OCT59_005658 [Rhizophagus irregularis]|uniref:uncharacterized protein n=1 Tax=Rhizophagus irregularis TaxID=588596 RepID=UPI00332D3B0A|nr:hypothetical protein OCT59_005658 [Rhizophagus irregularis]